MNADQNFYCILSGSYDFKILSCILLLKLWQGRTLHDVFMQRILNTFFSWDSGVYETYHCFLPQT